MANTRNASVDTKLEKLVDTKLEELETNMNNKFESIKDMFTKISDKLNKLDVMEETVNSM